MNPRGYLINGNFYDENISDSKLDLVTPLYTEKPIVKEQLTDEEIADFLYAYCLDMGDVYEVSEEQFIKCVRAILKEAQDL